MNCLLGLKNKPKNTKTLKIKPLDHYVHQPYATNTKRRKPEGSLLVRTNKMHYYVNIDQLSERPQAEAFLAEKE